MKREIQESMTTKRRMPILVFGLSILMVLGTTLVMGPFDWLVFLQIAASATVVFAILTWVDGRKRG